MKVQSEFGFEPSLLVEMEREQVPDGDGGFKLVHRATVLGDRFDVLDGKSEVNPTFEFFRPHVERLKPGVHSVVTMNTTETGADVEGNVGWDREKQARTIFAEEIQGAIVSVYPGQTSEEKKKKADILNQIFGTRSWTKITEMPSQTLQDGLGRLKEALGLSGHVGNTPEPNPDDQLPGAEMPPKAPDICTEIRQLLHRDGIREHTLLGYLVEIGTLEGAAESLDDANHKQPALLPMVLTMWKEISDRILEATGKAKA